MQKKWTKGIVQNVFSEKRFGFVAINDDEYDSHVFFHFDRIDYTQDLTNIRRGTPVKIVVTRSKTGKLVCEDFRICE